MGRSDQEKQYKSPMSSAMNTTETLARFIAHYDAQAVPDAVRRHAVKGLVNWAGCAVGGGDHPAVQRAMHAFKPFMGPGHATILGRVERTDAMHAALFNGISSHVLDFDDTHLATLVHPSGPVLSALLAYAQHHRINGKTFVDALVFGIEVECRIAMGVCPAHYDIGWHVTGTVGGFGAAAAIARAMHLDVQRVCWALGIAGTQASGLREVFGTMCKSLHPGRAAQSGLSAALLAQSGFTSSERVLEAPRGFANVLSSAPHLQDCVEDLGSRWEVLANSFKPYACGVVIHPIIDACIALHRREGFAIDEIERIDFDVHPLVLELTGKTKPATGLEGKFSVYHSAAIAMIEGRNAYAHYSDEAVARTDVIALRKKVHVKAMLGIRENETRVRVHLRGAAMFSHHVEFASGSLQRPLSEQALDEKFLDLAEPTLGSSRARIALQACWNIELTEDAGALAPLLALP